MADWPRRNRAEIKDTRKARPRVERLLPCSDEQAPVTHLDQLPEYCQRAAVQVLRGDDPSGTARAFAAGSPIWKPRMAVAARRAAHVTGWPAPFAFPTVIIAAARGLRA